MRHAGHRRFGFGQRSDRLGRSVIPHLCRRYIGNDYRKLLPASMLFGATFLLLVDNISRNLLVVEIPIGILTAFIGAPFFIYLMRQKGGGV